MRSPSTTAATTAATTATIRSSAEKQESSFGSCDQQRLEFDYVIVGAGPSAMGLLRRLLESFDDNESSSEETAAAKIRSLSIAIVERGFPPDLQNSMRKKDSNTKQGNLSRWFEAAHDPSSPYVTILQTTTTTPENSTSASTYHRKRRRMMLDIPLGRGVGGGSNINAGLCVAPPAEDFAEWPDKPWKEHLPGAVEHLQEVLVTNRFLYNAADSSPILTTQSMDSSKSNDTEKAAAVVPCLAKYNQQSERLERANYYDGLVEPLLLKQLQRDSNNAQPQIQWFCEKEAQRLLLDGSRVMGVEILWNTTAHATTKTDITYMSIFARKEVILCMGAIETPALLMASGIGPPPLEQDHNHNKDGSASTDDLRKTNKQYQTQQQRPFFVDIPGVGQNLRDHVILPRVLLTPPLASITTCALLSHQKSTTATRKHTNNKSSISSINGIHRMAPFAVKDQDQFLLLTSTTVPEIALHFFSRILYEFYRPAWMDSSGKPTILLIILRRFANLGWWMLDKLINMVVLYSPVYWILKYTFTTMNLALVNPKSTGSLCLVTKPGKKCQAESHMLEPKVFRRRDYDIQLDPPYLKNPRDISSLWQGWVASPAISTDSFAKGWEVFPGILFRFLYGITGNNREQHCESVSKSFSAPPVWFSEFAMDTSLPFYHWCGTCSMKSCGDGDDDRNNLVVEDELQLRHIQSLRICDASIFPSNLSVPPALACAGVGYVLGGILMEALSGPTITAAE